MAKQKRLERSQRKKTIINKDTSSEYQKIIHELFQSSYEVVRREV